MTPGQNIGVVRDVCTARAILVRAARSPVEKEYMIGNITALLPVALFFWFLAPKRV